MTTPDATVQTIIALVPHLPEPTRRQLRQMLANDIAAPTSAELREARLGLLIELVAAGDGRANTDNYEAQRVARAADGELWPSRSRLSRAYGSWLHALDAATTLAGEPLAAGAPSERGRSRVAHRYTRNDLLLAIQRCQLAIGEWPTATAYGHWRRLALRASRQHGHANAPIPSVDAVTKRIGTWARATQLASAATSHHGPPPSASGITAPRWPAPAGPALELPLRSTPPDQADAASQE